MRPPRAIVFDLDGTLADTRRDIAAACNHALTAVGRPTLPVEVVAGYVGDGARMLLARALGVGAADPLVDAAMPHWSEYYVAHVADFSSLMPGVQEALGACAPLQLALATNKPRAATVALLDALGLSGRFQSVFAGGDGPMKPDPRVIHQALLPLGVHARDAWVVGDGPQDVGAGKGAGAETVAVLGGFGKESDLRSSEPSLVITSLFELPQLLELALSERPTAPVSESSR